LDNQATVNSKDRYGATALIRATEQGHIEIIKLLLKASADVNIQDKDGVSALMEAAITGKDELVDLLLQAGANPNLKNVDGKTALELAENKRFNKISTVLHKVTIHK
jgi:ankyrin repeat protein